MMNMFALMVMSIGQVLVPSDPIQVGGFRAVASSPTFTRYCATHNHYVTWQKQLGADGSWLYRKISQTAPRPVVTYTAPVYYNLPTYSTYTSYPSWGTWSNYRTPTYGYNYPSNGVAYGYGGNRGYASNYYGGGGGGGTCRGGMCVR